MNDLEILPINREEVISRAHAVGISLRDEGYLDVPGSGEGFWIAAPKFARELFALCLTIVNWFPRSEWRVLYVNPFNNFQVLESYQLGRLAFGPERAELNRDPPYAMLFLDRSSRCEKGNLIIADMIFCILLHEGHVQFFFDEAVGEYVGIQDGAIHVNATPERIDQIRSATEELKRDPSRFPLWALDVYARYQ